MSRLSKPTDDRPTLGSAREAWMRSLQVGGKSKYTLASYAYGLDKLGALVGEGTLLANVSTEDCEAALLAAKDAGLSVSSQSAIFRPLRTFFGWCVTRRLLDHSPMDGVSAPKVVVQPVEFVDDDEWKRLLATTVERSRHAFRARRDRAILLMLGTTGARLSEVGNLEVDDVDLALDVLTVHGKGGKDRLLPLLPDAKTALTAYLRMERPRSPHKGLGALWLAPKGAMGASGIAQMVAARGEQAGIAHRVHPHELRHRFVARALRAGMPAPLVMAVSGHTTPSMLNRYGAYTRSQDAMAALRELSAAGVA